MGSKLSRIETLFLEQKVYKILPLKKVCVCDGWFCYYIKLTVIFLHRQHIPSFAHQTERKERIFLLFG